MTDFSDFRQVNNLILSEWTAPQAQELFRNLASVLATLERNTGLDDSKPVSITRGQAWDTLASKFLALGELGLAEIVYSSWLQVFYDLQKAHSVRLHKGGPLHQLGVIYSLRDQGDTARRFFLLAFVEDMISDPSRMLEYPSYGVLKHVVRMPEKTLLDLRAMVEQRVAEKAVSPFPEEILLRYTLRTASQNYRPWEHGSPVFNVAFASALWTQVEQASTTKEKGDRLEELVAYLVETSEGLELAGTKVLTHEYEFDLLIRNAIVDDPLFEELGAYILVECRNWDARVDVASISHFVEKLRSTRCRTGLLVARHGITGEQADEERGRIEAARLSITKAHYQDRVVIVVLDESDLRRILAGETTLRSIIMQGHEDIRFDWKRPLA